MSFNNDNTRFFKHILAAALLLAGWPASARAVNIVMSGTNQTSEQPLISFIQDNFSNVNLTYGDFSNYVTHAAAIQAADLFIVGRQVSSGAYGNAANSASFNALTVPVVSFTSFVSRPDGNRWGWHAGGISPPLATVGAETTITAAGAAVLGSAAGTYDWYPEPDLFNAGGTGAVGGGEILATMGGDILVAHWNAGALSGTEATFGSERLLFNSDQADVGGATVLPTGAGRQALINALDAYTPLTAIPEPTSLALAGVIACGAGMARRRSRSAAAVGRC